MAYLDYNGLQRFKANLDAQTNDLISAVYDNTKTYDVGDYVIYNNDLYRCTTAITTAEAWTAAHWTQVALGDDVSDLKSDINELANYNYIAPALIWSVGQVKSDGTLGTSSSYKHTQLIPVKEGDLIEWSVNGGTSKGVCLYATSESNADIDVSAQLVESVIEGLLSVPTGYNYFRLSSVASAISDAYVRVYATSEALNEKTEDFFDGSGVRIGWIWRYGYIKYDGTLVSNSNYHYTKKIAVNAGEKYSITTKCSSATLAVALYDENGIVLEKSTAGNDTLTTYNITIPDGIEGMAFTCVNINLNDFKILKKGITISDIVPESETLDEDAVNLLIKKYASIPFAEHRCATINFQFDDGNVKDADIVNIFKGKNAVCGFALISNMGVGRVDEYLGYQKDGFELMSHSTDSDGMSDGTIPSATIEGKLKDSKKVLTGYGFNIRGWVTPRSAMAAAFIPLLSKYYDFAYTQYFGEYTGTGTPWFTKTAELNKLSRVSVQGTTLANMKAAVDVAIANNGFLTFYGHSANLDDGGTDYETTENLNELLDYINTKQADLQCVLLAPSDAVDFYFHVRHEDYLELLNE